MNARFLVAIVAVVTLIVVAQPRAARAFSGEVIEVTGSGKLFHFEGGAVAGVKTPVTKVSAAAVAACIVGAPSPCDTALENDAGGKAYISFDSDTSWRITTDAACTTSTTLTGVVGGDGNFMMAGTHALSNTQVVIQGKVQLAKGTLNPTGISLGAVLAVSDTLEHYALGTFRTAGAVLAACP
jgi:hypothetical protein